MLCRRIAKDFNFAAVISAGGGQVKGQLSVEMLVLLVVILGLAILVASTLMKSAGKASEKVEEKTGAVLEGGEVEATGSPGDYCVSDSGCRSGDSDTYSRKCN